MTPARNPFPRASRDTFPTDIEQLLEQYGREMSPEPAADFGPRVMAAIARAVPAVGDPPNRNAGRRHAVAAANLLMGRRRLTIRFALVAMLTVGLAAAALAAELRGNAGTTPPPGGEAAPAVSSPPTASFEPISTDEVDAIGPKSSGQGNETEPDDADDADSDADDEADERDEPEEDGGDGTDPPDDEADADGSSAPGPEETGAPDPDGLESEDPAPDDDAAADAAADPEATPEPTDPGAG